MKIIKLHKHFLNKVFPIIFTLVLIATTGITVNAGETVSQINPDYKLKRISSQAVQISGVDAMGREFSHRFEDIEAEIILAIYRNRDLDVFAPQLAKKYFLTKEDSRRYIKHVIYTLEQWDILLVADR